MNKARETVSAQEVEKTILAAIMGEAIELARERLKELFPYSDVEQLETWKRLQWLEEHLWNVRLESTG